MSDKELTKQDCAPVQPEPAPSDIAQDEQRVPDEAAASPEASPEITPGTESGKPVEPSASSDQKASDRKKNKSAKLPEESEEEDKLIRLPPRKDPEADRKKRRRIVKFMLLGAAALLVLTALLFILFPETFNSDAIRRYFHYLGKRDHDDYGRVVFDAGGMNDYGTLGDSFVLGSEGGLYLFDLNGNQRMTVQGTVAEPRVLTADDRTVCYAMSGSFFAVSDKNGRRILDTTLSGTILDMDLSRDGYVCYNLAGTEEKTTCTVLNREGTAIFRYKSSSQYLNLCAVSPKGKRIAVSGLSENNSTFSNAILIMQTDREIVAGSESASEAIRRLEIGNRLIYDLCFLSDDRICALTENAMLFVGTDGSIVTEFSFDESMLLGYSFSGNGFSCLLLRDSLGDSCQLCSFDQNGRLLGQVELRDDVRSLNARGPYIGVLSDNALTVYRKDLSRYAEIDNAEIATRLLLREDGTALLISGDHTKLVFP